MIFCLIVRKIGYSGFPVDKELASDGMVADLVEAHVDGFGAPLFYGVIVKYDGG